MLVLILLYCGILFERKVFINATDRLYAVSAVFIKRIHCSRRLIDAFNDLVLLILNSVVLAAGFQSDSILNGKLEFILYFRFASVPKTRIFEKLASRHRAFIMLVEV